MEQAAPSVASIVVAFLAGWAVSLPGAPVPPASSAAHAIDCSCDAELRELLAARDALDWWRVLALILGVVAAVLLLVAVTAVLCLLGACQCIGWACRRGPAARGPVQAVRPPVVSVGDAKLLSLLAASEVRR